jgi:hypothetical protein
MINEITDGWWLQISPLARINPDEWIVGVLRKGKQSWVTEKAQSGFSTPQEAYEWGLEWIDEYKTKQR